MKKLFVALCLFPVAAIAQVKLPKNIISSYDKIDKKTTYEYKLTGRMGYEKPQTPARLRIIQSDTGLMLFLDLQYRLDTWIHADRIRLIFGNNEVDFQKDSLGSRSTYVDGGGVVNGSVLPSLVNEVYTIMLDASSGAVSKDLENYLKEGYFKAFEKALNGFSKKDEFVIRWYGANGYTDFPDNFYYSKSKMSKNVKQLQEMLAFYKTLTEQK